MVLRIALFLSMALGLLGVGGVGWLATHGDPPPAPVAETAPVPPPPLPGAPPTVSVLVAAKPLHAGILLKPEDVVAQDVPAAGLPAGTTTATGPHRSDLVGAMLRRQLGANEPILGADVMLPGDHGFLAAVLQPGMRGATLSVDAVSGAAGLVWPGDRIDLLLTQALEDPKLPAGRRLAGEVVLADVRIIAVDAQLVRGAAGSDGAAQMAAKTITLEVTPEGAERVAVASRIGKLVIVVRAADDAQASDLAAKAGRAEPSAPPTRTTWASDVSRALDGRPAAGEGSVVKLFLGTGDGKEFRFQ